MFTSTSHCCTDNGVSKLLEITTTLPLGEDAFKSLFLSRPPSVSSLFLLCNVSCCPHLSGSPSCFSRGLVMTLMGLLHTYEGLVIACAFLGVTKASFFSLEYLIYLCRCFSLGGILLDYTAPSSSPSYSLVKDRTNCSTSWLPRLRNSGQHDQRSERNSGWI